MKNSIGIISFIIILFSSGQVIGFDSYCLVLTDTIPIFDSPVSNSEKIGEGIAGELYDCESITNDWVGVRIGEITGYLPRSAIYMASYKFKKDPYEYYISEIPSKSKYDCWYEVYRKTGSSVYRRLLLNTDDNQKIHLSFYYTYGIEFNEIPARLALWLDDASRFEENGEFLKAFNTWSQIALIFPNFNLSEGHAKVMARFRQAELLQLQKADFNELISVLTPLITKYHGIAIGGDEWNSKSDIWAVVFLINAAKEFNLTDTKILYYVNHLIECSQTIESKALLSLQKAAIICAAGKWEQAFSIWISLVEGEPLPWHSFKTRGDLRGAALWQIAKFGEKYYGDTFAINKLSTLLNTLNDQELIWVARYLLGKLLYHNSEIDKAKQHFYWCLFTNFEGMSLSPLPGNWAKPEIGYHKITPLLKPLAKKIILKNPTKFQQYPTDTAAYSIYQAGEKLWVLEDFPYGPEGWLPAINKGNQMRWIKKHTP